VRQRDLHELARRPGARWGVKAQRRAAFLDAKLPAIGPLVEPETAQVGAAGGSVAGSSARSNWTSTDCVGATFCACSGGVVELTRSCAAATPESASRAEQAWTPASPDHQSMRQPLVTLAVAGGQKVVDALRNQVA
jgi:hypothetical protein